MEKLTVRIRDAELATMLKPMADANHTSVNAYIVQLIAKDVERYKEKLKNVPVLQRTKK